MTACNTTTQSRFRYLFREGKGTLKIDPMRVEEYAEREREVKGKEEGYEIILKIEKMSLRFVQKEDPYEYFKIRNYGMRCCLD